MTADGRLSELDGLRGVAALLVVVYHLFARWAEPLHETTLYPHGNALASLPVLAYLGMYGVLLFFLISGFVIVMTLERSSGVADFAVRRVARLWPTMLVCATLSTLIINLSGAADIYPGVERWHVTPLEYVTSILFVSPGFVAALLDLPPAHWIEGVYWTLWAEVRFYVLIALVFLLFPGRRFLTAWAVVQALSTALELARAVFPEVSWTYLPPVLALQPRYLAWFSLGICGYMLWTRRLGPAVWIIAAFAVTAIGAGEIVTLRGGVPGAAPEAGSVALLYLAVVTPFALFLRRSRLLGVLSWRPVTAIGLASYPLYLFHERGSMAALPFVVQAGVPPWLAVGIVFACVIVVALAIHRLVEWPAKGFVAARGRPWARELQRKHPWLRFRRTNRAGDCGASGGVVT